jgi:hypothetical protein
MMDVKIAGQNIGYIPGAGDELPSCLSQIGYNIKILSDQDLKNGLSQFDAIITGIRAFNTNEKLGSYKPLLMDYVKNGGNLIVQYNTNSRVGPLQTSIGPYPFTISRNRVTNELSPVTIIDAKDPAVSYPNKISAGDFNGWIQERGIYFATETDKNYRTVLEMNDPGEKGHRGSIIISPLGKGNFVYTGISFFRELPAGVSGSYKLMANLLSLPKNK